ncbi:peptidoglycan-binding domain-containing protein [Streptomyces aureus]|uniref:Peptidoglycan-binding protein n=1 Tax=Streptomyces aureus TaxID=193461 RepID=A0ABV4SY41_9ACTN
MRRLRIRRPQPARLPAVHDVRQAVGPITESTVKQFQSWYDHGLAVDGKVGVQTWAALREVADGIHG